MQRGTREGSLLPTTQLSHRPPALDRLGPSEVVMGLALRDPSGTVQLALRHDPSRAAAMAGFDPIALAVPTRAGVQQWRQQFDDLGQPHGGIVSGHGGGAVLVGLHDPDGIEIRLYAD